MLKQELNLLNRELIKTGELTTKLFSVQYFDTRSVALFREQVQLSNLLRTEYEIYSRMYEQVHFINLIDEDMRFVEIDKIQFQQVITNLLQNAVKFLDKKDSVIIMEAYRKKGVLSVIIEDNGRGFQGINVESLFDQYVTGSRELIGLGMGLYLCKKIINMHGGTIIASIGERLGGAKFSIDIPLH
ncbi:MAG: ATP-binding protein [Candidatus Gracilibacteria bacterium]|nr:ATP-binding protein [Candidatus Gracilibacteria bacterium]